MSRHSRFLKLLAFTTLTSLGIASVAYASDVAVAVVDVTAPTNALSLAPGATGPITINMTVSGNQAGTATFDVYRDWTLSGGTFTGTNPQEFTVGPRVGGGPATTFSTTGTVSVAGDHASGTFTLAVGALDITNSNGTGAKLAAGAMSNYQVTVAAPPAPPSDPTPPAISYVLNPAFPDGSNDWYKGEVTLTWTVTENESNASLVKTGCVDQNIIADQAETTYSCLATSDGGSAGPVDVTIKRDATPPSVRLQGGPANGATYYLGYNVPSEPTCDATDNLSGVAACTVNDFSTTVGTHTVWASARDNAGNTGTSDDVTYTISKLDLKGFYQPVDMGGVFNTVKGGSTVPLKFEVFAGSTELTDMSIVKSFVQTKIACPGTAPEDTIESFSTTGGTSLRYDTTGGQFIQNWQTPKAAGSCHKVTMITQDDSSLVAFFKLK